MAAEIRPARPEEYAAAKALVEEYIHSLNLDLGFQRIEEELADFPGAYEPPKGRLLIVLDDGVPVDCVGVNQLEGDICELKRLYVRPAARKKGKGRKLAEAAIARAAELGYRLMRLDTLPSMTAAQALYRSLGFEEIEPYRFNPVPGTTFLERKLS